jgi:hypothetical protein
MGNKKMVCLYGHTTIIFTYTIGFLHVLVETGVKRTTIAITLTIMTVIVKLYSAMLQES